MTVARLKQWVVNAISPIHIRHTYQKISSDQNSAGARPELPHNHITLLLVHITMLGITNCFI